MPRILVVDDEEPIRLLLSWAFANAGYQVSTAADATQALTLLGSHTFDVLLSDVTMPAIDGHELVRRVALNYPAVRCILMTGVDIECGDCPFPARCAFLAKPFRPNAAVALVKDVLGTPGA